MKNYLVISAGSALIGLILMGICLPFLEGRTEGLCFTLGILGLPLTMFGDLLTPISVDNEGWLLATVIILCYFAQWQFIAWLAYKKVPAYLMISVGCALVGLILMGICLPSGGEGRTEGIGFTLGILGMPLTFLGLIILSLIPLSWDSGGWIYAIIISLCYFAQWQLIAWFIYYCTHDTPPRQRKIE